MLIPRIVKVGWVLKITEGSSYRGVSVGESPNFTQWIGPRCTPQYGKLRRSSYRIMPIKRKSIWRMVVQMEYGKLFESFLVGWVMPDMWRIIVWQPPRWNFVENDPYLSNMVHLEGEEWPKCWGYYENCGIVERIYFLELHWMTANLYSSSFSF